ncbi:hypothetical protein [Sinorhizobium terangae]|uniref:hypothetical protein n=1 Tax=Sinorhizobium terangae TaxID=110322 RepID=UPI0024B21E45|nr:hypothetical protein [Sinorhizobium terangae]WFU51147.1 hypothetical protein QA637_21375 [Sinorhizobium terangae]
MAPTREPSDDQVGSAFVHPTAAEGHEQMERILADPTFQASPRRRALLRYLVEETFAGRADRLKGYAIALAVFGRDDKFDPQFDPVVRLEARRLRRDLDGYYAGAGSHDRLRISIPKGGYVTHFAWQGEARSLASPLEGQPERGGLANAEAVPEVAHAAAAELSTERTVDNGAGDHPHRPAIQHSAFVAAALVAILVVGIAGAAWFWLLRDKYTDALARGPAVIVLPFEALSSGEDDRFLAAGLTQELITDLMRFGGFRLFSLPASFRQDANADPVALGQRLAASYVVKGNLRSDARIVRVGVQLIETRSGQLLWSETYDLSMTPNALLSVQHDLSTRIAAMLGQPYGIVNNDAASHLLEGDAPSMPSYDCILRAYAYRRTFSAELYAPALKCLEESVRRDPQYAAAWAMLGWLHLDAARFDWAPEGRWEAEFEQAFRAAEHAVALDPTSALALQALSSINYYAGRHDEAERIQRKALKLNPNDPDTLAQLGWRLAARGKWDEGIPLLQRAIDRTVSPPGWYFHLIVVHHYLQGHYREALAAAERARIDGSGLSWSFLAIAHGALGNQYAARQALAEMAARSPLLARDPAAAYRRHQAIDTIVDRLVAGLRKAGWTEPRSSVPSQP